MFNTATHLQSCAKLEFIPQLFSQHLAVFHGNTFAKLFRLL